MSYKNDDLRIKNIEQLLPPIALFMVQMIVY